MHPIRAVAWSELHGELQYIEPNVHIYDLLLHYRVEQLLSWTASVAGY